MIYTLTANPSLDYIMRVDHFETGETNRAEECALYPGGKGINVSTILGRLGHENTALGFVAGFSGQELVRMLEERRFKKDFIDCAGYTRINVKLKSGRETEINGCGLQLCEADVEKLKTRIRSLNEKDVLILSGSVPAGMDSMFYRHLLDLTKDSVLSAVDATGDLLLHTLERHPFLIKPNQDELEALFDQKLESVESLARAARRLQDMGAKNVLVSREAKGALLAGMDGAFYTASCPQGKLVNSVGSGDSMVAGFMAGYLDTENLKEALALGVYCGSATAFCSDLAQYEDIQRLQNESPIEIQQFTL